MFQIAHFSFFYLRALDPPLKPPQITPWPKSSPEEALAELWEALGELWEGLYKEKFSCLMRAAGPSEIKVAPRPPTPLGETIQD